MKTFESKSTKWNLYFLPPDFSARKPHCIRLENFCRTDKNKENKNSQRGAKQHTFACQKIIINIWNYKRNDTVNTISYIYLTHKDEFNIFFILAGPFFKLAFVRNTNTTGLRFRFFSIHRNGSLASREKKSKSKPKKYHENQVVKESNKNFKPQIYTSNVRMFACCCYYYYLIFLYCIYWKLSLSHAYAFNYSNRLLQNCIDALLSMRFT